MVGLLAKVPLDLSFCPPKAGVIGLQCHDQLLRCVLGIKLRSFCFNRKHFKLLSLFLDSIIIILMMRVVKLTLLSYKLLMRHSVGSS